SRSGSGSTAPPEPGLPAASRTAPTEVNPASGELPARGSSAPGAVAEDAASAGAPRNSNLNQGGVRQALPPENAPVRPGPNPSDPSRGVLYDAERPPGVDPSPPQRQGYNECG